MEERNSSTALDEQATASVLICRAPHPRATDTEARFRGHVHGVRLQVVPFRARPTYRHVRGWSDIRPRCVVVRCLSCGAFSEYAVVGAVQTFQTEGLAVESPAPRPEALSLGPLRFPLPTPALEGAEAWRPLPKALQARGPQDGRVAHNNHPTTQE